MYLAVVKRPSHNFVLLLEHVHCRSSFSLPQPAHHAIAANVTRMLLLAFAEACSWMCASRLSCCAHDPEASASARTTSSAPARCLTTVILLYCLAELSQG